MKTRLGCAVAQRPAITRKKIKRKKRVDNISVVQAMAWMAQSTGIPIASIGNEQFDVLAEQFGLCRQTIRSHYFQTQPVVKLKKS